MISRLNGYGVNPAKIAHMSPRPQNTLLIVAELLIELKTDSKGVGHVEFVLFQSDELIFD